ncbi:hypothetical protein [Siminovitchia acidinfaciens]|nr:hypothetical protein [Siminovitchia acidinfaciens]
MIPSFPVFIDEFMQLLPVVMSLVDTIAGIITYKKLTMNQLSKLNIKMDNRIVVWLVEYLIQQMDLILE